ncbi:PAS domain S-box protein [Microcoleus sp. FACHB-SPT15]|uniref:hybrid sensor histidine kinase/response regulator n=1 Tax=Microcoleus sp. FACHB-SPT15 TaxID=2692830 RepID=UPI0017830613|nr:PAS domain S-box protein [Microcoleus sp. FACHB-SPT15]MBD1807023.1 PAS domain S-box protein [Microcoleus sp. FACHB-SPT15]
MRTSEQIKAEIEEKFGFFPPFFAPGEQTPQVLDNLWQQTISAYVDNPLPPLFKEKLSAYLSRFCSVPYCMICHSCSLHALGMQAQEVLELLESPLPTPSDIDKHLRILVASDVPKLLQEGNAALEESLLYCSIFIALKGENNEYYRSELRRLLGGATYQHLVSFIAYVKTCHVWMEAHPEVVYQADKRVQDHFDTLLKKEPGLSEFFNNYCDRVRREHQSWAEQMARIHERKQNEETLRKLGVENLRLARTVASVSDSVLITDPNQFDNPIIYTNPAFSRITGYQPEEVLGRNCRFLQGSGTNQQTIEQIDAYLARREEVNATVLNYRKDGKPFWNELKISPVFSEEGDLLYFVGIQRDITEYKQAEAKICEQAALLDVATDAIFVRDLEDKILLWNKGAERLYGWNSEEVLGKQAVQLLNQEKIAHLREIRKTVFEEGLWKGELHQVTKDGKRIIVESRWTLVRDEEEKPKSILVVNTDITEKIQLEAQFLRAQRMESIGTLASGIAHDLNNELTPILASAQLLLLPTKLSEEKKRQLLKTIETSTKRGAALVKQVLLFARGVEGKRTILQTEQLILDIKQIVEETFPKSLDIQTHIQKDSWMINGDATQLHQVLINLCVNARDAMPKGGTLSLSATNLFIDENFVRMNLDATVGSYILITVSDTGMGIPPTVIDRIFEPFFTTKEQGKGTGLGLSTVMGIIKSHGGFVDVTSRVGKGTQFKIYLPAIRKAETQQTEDGEFSTGQGELILVVDDEAAICEINKTSLEAYNYRVVTASDGIEAIALYVQHKDDISLVIVDMMMPSMDGPTTIRTLHKINPNVKIIAVSGLISSAQLTDATNAGIQRFLPKPYTARDLLKTINEVLDLTTVPL